MSTPVSKLGKHVLPPREEPHDLDARMPAALREPLRPLHRREIDHRIEHIAGEVAGTLLARPTVLREGVRPRPRWISAGDFVERMRPFLVYN